MKKYIGILVALLLVATLVHAERVITARDPSRDELIKGIAQDAIERMQHVISIVDQEYNNGEGTLVQRQHDALVNMLNRRIQTIEKKRDRLLGMNVKDTDVHNFQKIADNFVWQSKEKLRHMLEETTVRIGERFFAKMDKKEAVMESKINFLKEHGVDVTEVASLAEQCASELKTAEQLYAQAKDAYQNTVASMVDVYYGFIVDTRQHARNAQDLARTADEKIDALMKGLIKNSQKKILLEQQTSNDKENDAQQQDVPVAAKAILDTPKTPILGSKHPSF